MGVRQTEFGENGNCLRAVLATIFTCPLEAVVDVLDGVRPEIEWYKRVEAWCLARGYEVDVVGPMHPPPGLALASGLTVRSDQRHAIVAKDGRAWWDPHPSDLFIISADYYLRFTPIDPFDEWPNDDPY